MGNRFSSGIYTLHATCFYIRTRQNLCRCFCMGRKHLLWSSIRRFDISYPLKISNFIICRIDISQWSWIKNHTVFHIRFVFSFLLLKLHDKEKLHVFNFIIYGVISTSPSSISLNMFLIDCFEPNDQSFNYLAAVTITGDRAVCIVSWLLFLINQLYL
jgi:hypothetical protein